MASDTLQGLEQRIKQRETTLKHPLQTIPIETHAPHGNIPNTPLAASTIAFLLGSTFSIGLLMFVNGGFDRYWWSTAQLGFFIAAWAGFHWGEFATTAGWNLEKCSIDCGFVIPLTQGFSIGQWERNLYFRTLSHLCSLQFYYGDSSIVGLEEKALVDFFGADYIRYQQQVGTKIPFVP
ncbi:hypothetical protein C0992_007806 [Termitomyces sp. T32_za158]|nr:hypothetical protein C0992_007806 [Termitomyces sp. T32_za158]